MEIEKNILLYRSHKYRSLFWLLNLYYISQLKPEVTVETPK